MMRDQAMTTPTVKPRRTDTSSPVYIGMPAKGDIREASSEEEQPIAVQSSVSWEAQAQV